MFKKIRRTLAVISFVGITLLFLDFTGALHGLLSWLANIQLVPAVLALNFVVVVALLVLTLVFGRIYCSVICPLGILQDICTRLGIVLHDCFSHRQRFYVYHKELPWARYGFLVVFIVLLLLGFGSFAGLIEPYSVFGRIAANLMAPVYGWGNNILATIAEHAESYAFYSTDVWVKGGVSLLVAVVTLVLIVTCAVLTGRSYCNTVCPVGTFLGFFSRFSYMKIVIDAEHCKNCARCEHHCKAHCINMETKTIDYSRCVVCGNCLKACKANCIAYGPKKMIDKENAIVKDYENDKKIEATANGGNASIDGSRRAFLLSAAAVTAGAALAQAEKKVDGGLAVIEDKQIPERKGLLVPPGSESARHLAQHCTACQLCISACPNGVLRPSTDFSNLMQPVMQYERGYCRPECNRCSEVCPTGAIRLIDLAEKSSIKIGTARVIAANCVTANGVSCGNCARHCPVGAIHMVNFKPEEEGSVSSPVVDPECCIGCGACENLCPVRPISAIIVDGIEQHRTI